MKSLGGKSATHKKSDVTLTPPVYTFIDRYLVGTAFVVGDSGQPSSLTGIPNTEDFCVLLGANGLQAVAEVGVAEAVKNSNLSAGYRTSGPGYSAQYSYAMNLGKPTAEFIYQDSSIFASLPLTGSASATVTAIPGIWFEESIGIAFNAWANPDPAAEFQLAVYGNQLWLTVKVVKSFSVYLNPKGNPVEWALTAAAWLVVKPIVNFVTGVVTRFIRDISFPIWDASEVSISVDGVDLTCTAENVTMASFGTSLAVTGSFQVGDDADNPVNAMISKGLPSPEALKDSESCVPLTQALYDGAAVGQELTGGVFVFGNYREMGKGTITELTTESIAAKGTYDVKNVPGHKNIAGKGTFDCRVSLNEDGKWKFTAIIEGTGRQQLKGKPRAGLLTDTARSLGKSISAPES